MAPLQFVNVSVRNTFLHAYSSEEEAQQEGEQPMAMRSKTAPGVEMSAWSSSEAETSSADEAAALSDVAKDARCAAECDEALDDLAGRPRFQSDPAEEDSEEEQPEIVPRVVTRDWFESPVSCRDAGSESPFFGVLGGTTEAVPAPAQVVWEPAAWAPQCFGVHAFGDATFMTFSGAESWPAWQQQQAPPASAEQVYAFSGATLAQEPFAGVQPMPLEGAAEVQRPVSPPLVSEDRVRAEKIGEAQDLPAQGQPQSTGTHSRRVAAAEGRRPAGAPGAQEGGRTTVMLRNLPNNYTRAALLSMIESEGFAGRFDFLYFPIDFRTHAALGYAFLNLLTPADAEEFRRRVDGFSRWSLPSGKVCSVGWSHPHQGLEAHIERYRNSPLMHDSVPDASSETELGRPSRPPRRRSSRPGRARSGC